MLKSLSEKPQISDEHVLDFRSFVILLSNGAFSTFYWFTHFCCKMLSLRFTHFFSRFFKTEKQNPPTNLLLECMASIWKVLLNEVAIERFKPGLGEMSNQAPNLGHWIPGKDRVARRECVDVKSSWTFQKISFRPLPRTCDMEDPVQLCPPQPSEEGGHAASLSPLRLLLRVIQHLKHVPEISEYLRVAKTHR